MRLNYFNYNGKIYYTNTVIKIKPKKNKHLDVVEKAVFKFYIPEQEWYVVCLGSDDNLIFRKNEFYDSIIEIIDIPDTNKEHQIQQKIINKPTFKEELAIDGMLLAWIWFIFLMFLVTFFHQRVIGYIGIGIIFHKYRNKKLREAGYL